MAQPAAEARYDVVIIGGGGHGLATAYYLAQNHGITNVAVLEKGWIGGGNTGRNTTIVRSNYYLEANAHFYEHSLKLWEGLSPDLNYNVMFSQRGVINLAHSYGDLDAYSRRGNAMRLNGIDAELAHARRGGRAWCRCSTAPRARAIPIMGGLLQRARRDRAATTPSRGATPRGADARAWTSSSNARSRACSATATGSRRSRPRAA